MQVMLQEVAAAGALAPLGKGSLRDRGIIE
jgi:hypothetical protein